jgi:hypothetical protein
MAYKNSYKNQDWLLPLSMKQILKNKNPSSVRRNLFAIKFFFCSIRKIVDSNLASQLMKLNKTKINYIIRKRIIQKLLGHSSIKTTQIYTQISQANKKYKKSFE